MLKEIRLSPNIADHDIATKARNADKMLEKKIQVRFNVQMRGRMLDRPEFAKEVLDKITGLLKNMSTKTQYTYKDTVVSCVCNPKK